MPTRQAATTTPEIVTLEKELERLRRKKELVIREGERLGKDD